MSEYILDVRGLVAWAKLSENEYGVIKAAINDGRILLFSRVWQEFQKIYPDEADIITRDADPRRRIPQADRLAASALADSVDATFGPYDDGCDWVVAGKAVAHGLIVVTDEPALSGFYHHLDCCHAVSISDLLDELE